MRTFTGFRRFRTLAVGFALGFVAGSATLSGAAFGRTGWERFGPMFKQGYVAGFVECVRIAKALDPFSYIAMTFPAPPKAKPNVWMAKIDELYATPEHADRTLPQIMIIAGSQLSPAFGDDDLKAGDRRLEQLRQAIDRQRKALLQARKTVETAEGEAKKGGKATTGAAADDGAKNDKSAAAAQATPKPEAATPDAQHDDAAKPDGAAADAAPKKPQADPDAPNHDEHEQEE